MGDGKKAVGVRGSSLRCVAEVLKLERRFESGATRGVPCGVRSGQVRKGTVRSMVVVGAPVLPRNLGGSNSGTDLILVGNQAVSGPPSFRLKTMFWGVNF
jgi:hypothetical protein